jgi:GNAT superfamily N-acetyltransferase
MLADGTYDVPQGKLAVVVTHLQMLARATTRNLPLAHGIAFRKVDVDLAWYRDVFHRVGASWLWFGRRVMEDEALMAILNDPNVAIYTLDIDGQSEALLELDFRKTGECELAYFGLTDRLIGSGAGRYLMDQAIDLAWSKPISRFHVHTCTGDSPQALDFYVRSGFTPFKRQIEIGDDPRVTGLLPRGRPVHKPVI